MPMQVTDKSNSERLVLAVGTDWEHFERCFVPSPLGWSEPPGNGTRNPLGCGTNFNPAKTPVPPLGDSPGQKAGRKYSLLS